MIPYFTDARQVELNKGSFAVENLYSSQGSSDLFIQQLLALAECRLFKFSFRALQKYYILP